MVPEQPCYGRKAVVHDPKDGLRFKIAGYLFQKVGYVFQKVGYVFQKVGYVLPKSCCSLLCPGLPVNNI